MQQLQQQKPPTARPNPRAGGDPRGGGNPLGNDTAALSAAQRGAIGDHVRECWTKDPGALDLEKKRGHNRAAIALANKMTRIAWAVWSKGCMYQPANPEETV